MLNFHFKQTIVSIRIIGNPGRTEQKITSLQLPATGLTITAGSGGGQTYQGASCGRYAASMLGSRLSNHILRFPPYPRAPAQPSTTHLFTLVHSSIQLSSLNCDWPGLRGMMRREDTDLALRWSAVQGGDTAMHCLPHEE